MIIIFKLDLFSDIKFKLSFDLNAYSFDIIIIFYLFLSNDIDFIYYNSIKNYILKLFLIFINYFQKLIHLIIKLQILYILLILGSFFLFELDFDKNIFICELFHQYNILEKLIEVWQ